MAVMVVEFAHFLRLDFAYALIGFKKQDCISKCIYKIHNHVDLLSIWFSETQWTSNED